MGEDLDTIIAENHVAAEKQRAEAALQRLRVELTKANERLQRQKMQIDTLNGRVVAVRLASEDASQRGQPWNVQDVRRFTALPRGPPDFTNDALRELLDQAEQAAARRVRDAVVEGTRARAESEQADTQGEANLEDAFAKVKEPVAELAARSAVGKLLINSNRMTTKLRVALRCLEEEATAAQVTHAADLRSLAARLVAQRDAHTEVVLAELEHAESDGENSIASLLCRVRALRGEIESRDATIGELRSELAGTQRTLREERCTRRADGERAVKDRKILSAEIERLEVRHAIVLREGCSHTEALATELMHEEAERAADAAAAAAVLAEAAAERERKVSALEAKLKALKIEARMMHAELIGKLKQQDKELAAVERRHADALVVVEAVTAKKESYLRTKIDGLGRQVRALRASSSNGRAMLYWTSMDASRGKSSSKRAQQLARGGGGSGGGGSGEEDGPVWSTLDDDSDREDGGGGAWRSPSPHPSGRRHLASDSAARAAATA